MKKKLIIPILCSLALIFLVFGCNVKAGPEKYSFEKTLVIGSESGDQRYVFGDISGLALDAEENIYALDRNNYKITIFDPKGNYARSIEIRKGQGPEEVSFIYTNAVTGKGRIFVLDGNGTKILVIDERGKIAGLLKVGFRAISISPYSDETIAVLGLDNGHLFHVMDAQGKISDSFGEPYEIPSAYSQYGNLAQMLLPRRADHSMSGRLYLVSPFKYEIRIYQGRKLKKLLEHKSDVFSPLEIKRADEDRIGMVFPWVSVLEHENRLFVCIEKNGPGASNQIDIFKDCKYQSSLRVSGFAAAVDRKGCLYFIEKEDFPKIVKYSLKRSTK